MSRRTDVGSVASVTVLSDFFLKVINVTQKQLYLPCHFVLASPAIAHEILPDFDYVFLFFEE